MSSPSADVRLNVAANSAASQLDMMTSKMKRYLQGIETGTDSVNRKGKKANQTFTGWGVGIAKSTGNLLAMGTVLSGLYSTTQLIGQEFQNMVDQSNMARERQIPAQELAKSFYLESIPNTVGNKEDFMRTVNEMVKGSGVQDKSNLWRLLRTSMSTMGNADPMERAEFGVTLAEARRDLMGAGRFEELNSFAGVSAMAHLNYKDQGSTARAQIELMQETITASAVADMTSFSRNIAPVGNKLQNFGANQIEGLGLAAALSTVFNDQTGQLVDTAANNMLAKLSMAENRFGIDPEGKTILERHAFIRSEDPKAASARKYLLASFQADAERLTDSERSMLSEAQLNKELAPKLGGRAKTLFGAMQFFQPAGTADESGSLNDLFRSNLKEIGAVFKSENVIDVRATYESLEREQRRKQAFVERDDIFKTANESLGTKEALESVASARENTFFGEFTTPDSEYDKLLKSSGGGWGTTIDRMASRTKAYFGSPTGLESSETTLKRMRNELTARIEEIRNSGEKSYRDQDGNEYSVPPPRIMQWMQGLSIQRTVSQTEEQSAMTEALTGKLQEVVALLETIRNQGDDPTPKKVAIDNPSKTPEKPTATQIGN